MSKFTIEYKWKTYKWCTWWTIQKLIEEWYLVELQPQEEKQEDPTELLPWPVPHEPCTWNLPTEEVERNTKFWDEENKKNFPWYKKEEWITEEKPEETLVVKKKTIEELCKKVSELPLEPSKLQKLRAELDKLPRYYRSKFSADLSRWETQDECNTEMVDYSQVESVLNELENTSILSRGKDDVGNAIPKLKKETQPEEVQSTAAEVLWKTKEDIEQLKYDFYIILFIAWIIILSRWLCELYSILWSYTC